MVFFPEESLHTPATFLLSVSGQPLLRISGASGVYLSHPASNSRFARPQDARISNDTLHRVDLSNELGRPNINL